MKIALVTLGCRTNQAEMLEVEHAFLSAGHQVVGLQDQPDVCIVNTCTVTTKADAQSRQMIARALRNCKKVVATGCYADLNAAVLGAGHPGLTVVLNAEKSALTAVGVTNHPAAVETYSFRSRPIIKVQDGCNHSCTYCIVPKARGASRSTPVEEVIDRVAAHTNGSATEVVLSGIHLGTYGQDLAPQQSLASLVRRLLIAFPSIRVRLSSLEINEIDAELLETLQDPRLCRHLHVPLQSGSDSILRSMNRPYKVSDFTSKLALISTKLTDFAFGTDIIVGFPGEDSSAFEDSRLALNSLPFSYLHVFPYSQRSGTPAASFPDQVSSLIKKTRVQALRELSTTLRKRFIASQVASRQTVVVEDAHQSGFTGTTSNYIKVRVECTGIPDRGSLVDIVLSHVDGAIAVGIPINLPEQPQK